MREGPVTDAFAAGLLSLLLASAFSLPRTLLRLRFLPLSFAPLFPHANVSRETFVFHGSSAWPSTRSARGENLPLCGWLWFVRSCGLRLSLIGSAPSSAISRSALQGHFVALRLPISCFMKRVSQNTSFMTYVAKHAEMTQRISSVPKRSEVFRMS